MKTPLRVTVEEAEKNFDFLFSLVERGETILIEAEKGNVMMVPVNSAYSRLEEEKAAQYMPMGPTAPIPGVTLPSDAEVRSYVDETLDELSGDL
tara:strand:+ start:3421 stop:3702 length:282 start_codon:yes stop_codon:yes gene_type:complete